MPVSKERLPSFTEKNYQPEKMRQMVAVLERWYSLVDQEVSSNAGETTIERSMAFFLGR